MPAENVSFNNGEVMRDYGQNATVDVYDTDLQRAAAGVVVVKKHTGHGKQYIWRHGTGARLTRGQCAHLLSRLIRDEMLSQSALVVEYQPNNGN